MSKKTPDTTESPTEATAGFITALNERSRTYHWPNAKLKIKNVIELIVRPSGTHRIRTKSGKLFVIADSWLAIEIVDKKKNWTV